MRARRPKSYREPRTGKRVPIRWPKRPRVDGEDVASWIDRLRGEMSICGTMPEDEQVRAMIHEQLHYARLTLPEYVVLDMEKIFADFVLGNPHILDWFAKVARSRRAKGRRNERQQR